MVERARGKTFLEPLKEEDCFPGTQWHQIGDGVAWRNYKHWGTGVYAGEGIERRNGDGSGCRTKINGLWWTCVPTVVEARGYQKGDKMISAVFSYPGGIGIDPYYFWEIYPVDDGIERYTSEVEMEARIKELLADTSNAD